MNIEERFTELITRIEAAAFDYENLLPAKDILTLVARSFCLADRDLATAYRFLTDELLINYIKERKMMAAYRYLIEDEDAIADRAAEIAGFDNQSSFSKRFKDIFEISPIKASRQKDMSMFLPSLSWEQLLNSKPIESVNLEEIMPEKTVFGIDVNTVNKLKQIYSLQAIYDFSDYMCDVIYSFSDTHKVPLEKTFEYFNEIFARYKSREYMELYEEEGIFYDSEKEYYEAEQQEDMENEGLIYMYFKSGFSGKDAYEIWFRAYDYGIDVLTLSHPEIVLLTCEDMHITYCLKAGKYFSDMKGLDYADEELEYYIEFLEEGEPIQIAFASACEEYAIDSAVDDVALSLSFDDLALSLEEYDEEAYFMENEDNVDDLY